MCTPFRICIKQLYIYGTMNWWIHNELWSKQNLFLYRFYTKIRLILFPQYKLKQVDLSLPFLYRFWHCRCTQTTVIREQPNFLYSIQPCTVLEGRKVESGAASTARNSVQMTSSNGSNVFVCNHIIFMHCLHPALSFLFCVSPSFSGCSTRDIYTFLHFFRF